MRRQQRIINKKESTFGEKMAVFVFQGNQVRVSTVIMFAAG
jgi:hypothetical protein